MGKLRISGFCRSEVQVAVCWATSEIGQFPIVFLRQHQSGGVLFGSNLNSSLGCGVHTHTHTISFTTFALAKIDLFTYLCFVHK